MDTSWDDSRRAFADAADWFVHTVRLVGDRWDRPGLGEWDVRALVVQHLPNREGPTRDLYAPFEPVIPRGSLAS